jgi:hypothetical protein
MIKGLSLAEAGLVERPGLICDTGAPVRSSFLYDLKVNTISLSLRIKGNERLRFADD